MHQPADFFCKEIPPEHHRLEDSFIFDFGFTIYEPLQNRMRATQCQPPRNS
jgi:hypothetical protein